MESTLKELLGSAVEVIEASENQETIERARLRFLGRKGELTAILRMMKDVSADDRPRIGQLANNIRDEIESRLSSRLKEVSTTSSEQLLKQETLDISLPGTRPTVGHRHPLSLVLNDVINASLRMGFDVFEGPEVEYDYYNFEALNIPKWHPARDMQDSFYLTEHILLRPHTSPFQARTLERMKPELPIRVICPGRCYRRDPADATHSPMFYQTEILAVDENISFANLKETLLVLARELFGADRRIRLRPSFFPFTEPSAEVDVSCMICDGAGCGICKGTGWIEILGCGIVHPRVLEIGGYDPDSVSGFAIGLGPDRIAMLKYGVDDIRLFYENDLRFLQQF